MKRKMSLPPIHYDESLLSDFLSKMREFSEINRTKFKIYWEGNSATYENETEMFDDTNIPDRIFEFQVKLYADKGQIAIYANSHTGEHTVVMNGEQEWVHSNINAVREFADQRRERLRRILQKRWMRSAQWILVGVILGQIGPYLISYFALHVQPGTLPLRTWIIAGLLVVSILSFEIIAKVYPFVVLRRRETEPQYKKLISFIPILLTVFSTGLALWDLLI